MLTFPPGLGAVPADELPARLKFEIERLDPEQLPLQQALAQSSHAVVNRFSARIIKTGMEGGRLCVKAGLFYSGIIAGCSCADDPTPVDEIAEYCEVEFRIDPASGAASVTLTG